MCNIARVCLTLYREDERVSLERPVRDAAERRGVEAVARTPPSCAIGRLVVFALDHAAADCCRQGTAAAEELLQQRLELVGNRLSSACASIRDEMRDVFRESRRGQQLISNLTL